MSILWFMIILLTEHFINFILSYFYQSVQTLAAFKDCTIIIFSCLVVEKAHLLIIFASIHMYARIYMKYQKIVSIVIVIYIINIVIVFG